MMYIILYSDNPAASGIVHCTVLMDVVITSSSVTQSMNLRQRHVLMCILHDHCGHMWSHKETCVWMVIVHYQWSYCNWQWAIMRLLHENPGYKVFCIDLGGGIKQVGGLYDKCSEIFFSLLGLCYNFIGLGKCILGFWSLIFQWGGGSLYVKCLGRPTPPPVKVVTPQLGLRVIDCTITAKGFFLPELHRHVTG